MNNRQYRNEMLLLSLTIYYSLSTHSACIFVKKIIFDITTTVTYYNIPVPLGRHPPAVLIFLYGLLPLYMDRLL